MRRTTQSPIKNDAARFQPKTLPTQAATGVPCDKCGKKNHYALVYCGRSKHNFANRNSKHRLVIADIAQHYSQLK